MRCCSDAKHSVIYVYYIGLGDISKAICFFFLYAEKTPKTFLTDDSFNASGEEESSSTTEITIACVLIGATIVIVKTGIIVIIQMVKCHR